MIAGFEAILVVTVLKTEETFEISEILVLKSVKERENTLVFFLLFLLVTRIKVTSSASGISTTIPTSRNGVGMGLGLWIVLIASIRIKVLDWGKILK